MKTFEQIILLLVSGQGILLSLGLLSAVFKKKYSTFYLGLITAVITIEVLNIWGMRVEYHSSTNSFPFWVFGSYLIIPAALWLFLKENTQPTFQSSTKHFLLFLPAIVEIIVELFLFFSNRVSHTNLELQTNQLWYSYTEIIPVITMVLVLILFGKELRSLNLRLRRIQAIKSNFNQVSKLLVIFVFFSILTTFWLLQTVWELQVFQFIEIILLLFIFVLGYIGLFQPSFFNIPKVLKTEIIKEQFSQFNDQSELARLKFLFEVEQVYLQQKLSLSEVAFTLNLPQRYVSGLINSYHGTNFSSYVNSFRVQEALKRINDPNEKNKTLLGIALESGFSSKSSFNQIFKTTTGKNPSDFLNV
ncbi:helix-turn-helix domain-containing protein [Maribacter sp. 2210JD10-5]|uniref:helix-turn-helix domain-containing protein n=1 Tax=Maribacter sp. 2210JD10-5 TaxID=3386272 RepID=UPI0039BC2390